MKPGIIGDGTTSRFSSVSLVVRASYDGDALGRALDRSVINVAALKYDNAAFNTPEARQQQNEIAFTWRVWWKPEIFWRDDLTWPSGQTTVCISRPGVSICYVSSLETVYQHDESDSKAEQPALKGIVRVPTLEDRLNEFPLFRPPLPSSDWKAEDAGDTSFLGRHARRLRFTRVAGDVPSDAAEQSGYWPGVDQYELVVDVQLHLAMSFAGLIDGVIVAVLSVAEILVDAVITPHIEHLRLPENVRYLHV